MARIEVDHSQLTIMATKIDAYISSHKANMKQINSEIDGLNVNWKGADYNQIEKEWNQIKSSESTSGKMLKSLDNYAEFLRFAANKYKSAQSNAINRANKLPRY